MSSFFMEGGVPLAGTVEIGGSKNAVLPLLFAALTVEGVTVLERVPDISDVDDALKLLEGFGVRTEREGGTLRLDATSVRPCEPDRGPVSRLRASTYLLGACLSRFGKAEILPWGGCAFSARPTDLHLKAAEAFGAVREGETLTAKPLRGGIFRPEKVSVGATVNALLMASRARGDSVLFRPATEPHVTSLIGFLNAAGCEIRMSEGFLTVHPRDLHGVTYSVIPDMIEAGTYLLSGPMTGGRVAVTGADENHLTALASALGECGFRLRKRGDGSLTVEKSGKARETSICAAPYPGFPTDLQPIFAAFLSTQAGGTVRDGVFPERFGYLDVLSAFGVRSDGRREEARIFPSELHRAEAEACDLRGGAAAVLTGLCASGRSVVRNAELPMRGYGGMAEKLASLGAKITLKAD